MYLSATLTQALTWGLALLSSLPPAYASPVVLHVKRAPSIPGPPADPTAPASGDGAGPYNSEDPSWTDRAQMLTFRSMAVAASGLGLGNAAGNLEHYLDNTGADRTNSPDDMMEEMPSFREAVQALATEHASQAFGAVVATGRGGSKTFVSPWTGFYATKAKSTDWFFALGGFSFAVAGEVAVRQESGGKWTGEVSYKVYVFDRYNWDSGKSVTIGPFTFEDTELGRMHLVGLAREYIVRGSSKVQTVEDYTGGTVRMPDTGGGR